MRGLASAADIARAAERLGFDGLVVPEVAHDPFLPLGLAAAATEKIQLTTGIAVAFARNPMTVAVVASDQVYVAAVGPAMTAVAGEVADGLCTHGFTTAEYVRQVTIPHLEEGLKRAGRSRSEVEVTIPAMTAIVEDERDSALDSVRATIAFYGSTPAYRPVLELHGFGALG